MEFEIIGTLNYKLLDSKSLLVLVEFLFVKLNFYWLSKYQQIQKIFIYITKMILHDYEILKKYSLKYLSASTVYISLKIIE